MWETYTPHPVLESYLQHSGYTELPSDPRELFFKLEASRTVSIEGFLEYAWANRNQNWQSQSTTLSPGFVTGLRITSTGSRDPGALTGHGEFWDNLLWHGVGVPLSTLIFRCFFENGRGWKDFVLSRQVASALEAGDLVVNLNYDTTFELALKQQGRTYCYSPNKPSADDIVVCKPHGSLNMVANDNSFTFGQPECLGMPQPDGYRSYSGIIPPRLNKSYEQHPAAAMILGPTRDRRPRRIVMWGVGLTESDADLLALYRDWSLMVDEVHVINPATEVAQTVEALLGCPTRHFESVGEWRTGTAKA